MTRLAAHQLPASRLNDILRSGGLDALPDAELLQRYARYGEQAAFDVLLRRHGSMVLGVCRRVLAHAADAEDAFQAVFLVFVRKARSIARGERLGPWLYGVAVRVALKARARRARLAERLEGSTDMIPDPCSAPETPEWLPVLDLELQALPAKYREPIILCELRGASRAEAARSLGIPEGTLSSRLARGRELLRRRLLKHGTLLPAGGLTALLGSGGTGRAGVPAALLDRTSELAAMVTPGLPPAGTVPAGAAQLMDEVLRGMMLTKLRLACSAILALVLVMAGALAARPGETPADPEKPKALPQAAGKPAVDRGDGSTPAVPLTDQGAVHADRDALQGLWVADKIDVRNAPPDQAQVARDVAGKMQFLVVGDVWWSMVAGVGEGKAPLLAKLDASKNPKWLDLTDFTRSRDVTRCIYELSGDRFRMCMTGDPRDPRPAEFGAEDEPLYLVFEFRREKLPPAAGDRTLVGSWQRDSIAGVADGQKVQGRPQRVEIHDGYLFATFEYNHAQEWIGGRYTVDTTKNPKWIDVDLGGPYRGDSKTTKLYGSYEVVDGNLKLALGRNAKRLMRPLELNPAGNVLFFDVKATKEPIPPGEKIVREPPAVGVKVLPGPTGAAVTPKTLPVPDLLPPAGPPASPLPVPPTHKRAPAP